MEGFRMFYSCFEIKIHESMNEDFGYSTGNIKLFIHLCYLILILKNHKKE